MLEETNENHPSRLWQIVDSRFSDEDWEDAYHKGISDFSWKNTNRSVNKEIPLSGNSLVVFINEALFEQQFGSNHWHLSRPKKLFYQLKPFIPRSLQIALRRIYRSSQEKGTGLRIGGKGISDCKDKVRLNWPIEDRYVRFQYGLVRNLMEKNGLLEVSHIAFWPQGKEFAFVLTHDVETKKGFKAIPKLVQVEKQYGFRSIFNIVPERYPVHRDYLDRLRADGFEIGIHGLKHDGKLFFSRKKFSKRAENINFYLKEYGAKGFRSPLTHRNPNWMQELEIEYDMSFFDTDPYEVMPGGTMSIWPLFMGHFVELPYTLVQDHTLLVILKEKTPRIWLEKVDFIQKCGGMALVNVHPDYLISDVGLRIADLKKQKKRRGKYPIEMYEELLRYVKTKGNYWHALPGEVTRWWRERAQRELLVKNGVLKILPHLEGGTIEKIKLDRQNLILE